MISQREFVSASNVFFHRRVMWRPAPHDSTQPLRDWSCWGKLSRSHQLIEFHRGDQACDRNEHRKNDETKDGNDEKTGFRLRSLKRARNFALERLGHATTHTGLISTFR